MAAPQQYIGLGGKLPPSLTVFPVKVPMNIVSRIARNLSVLLARVTSLPIKPKSPVALMR